VSRNPFRRPRTLTDRNLAGALTNHQQGLQSVNQRLAIVVASMQRLHRRFAWWQVWLVGVTMWLLILTIVVAR
jgi:hypothetical protein